MGSLKHVYEAASGELRGANHVLYHNCSSAEM